MATMCGPKFQTTVAPGIPIPGPVGPRGPSGIQGPPGPAGMNGAGLVVLGTVPSAADLPATGNKPGDGWIAEDTGHVWTWSGTTWIDGGPFGGPAGPQGIPGTAGPAGPAGPQGVPGSSNPATTTQLGSVIVSTGLNVQGSGALSIATGTNTGLALAGNTLAVNAGQGLIVLGNNTLAVSAGPGLSFTTGLALQVSPATQLAIGGVIVGSGLNVQANGTLSVPIATSSAPGLVIAGTGLNVLGNGTLSVATGTGLGITGNSVVLTPATATTLGGVIVGAGLTVQANGTLAAVQYWQAVSGGVYYGSNVGIGINPPAYTLDVGGQIHMNIPAASQGLLMTSGTLYGSMGSRFGGMSFGTTSADQLTFFTSNAPRVVISSGGAVTISYQLTCSAGAQVMGPLQVGASAILGQSGDLSVSRGSSPNIAVIYMGNTGSQAISFDGATYSFQNASVSMGGNLTVGGAINGSGSINSATNISATGSVTAGTTIYGASAQIASAILTTGNQVGIGTWPSGTSALTVAGNIQLTSGHIIFADGTTQATAGITSPPAALPHSPSHYPNQAWQNTSGTTMFVTVTFNAAGTATALVGTTSTPNTQVATTGGGTASTLFFPVPNGYWFIVNTAMTAASWVEWY